MPELFVVDNPACPDWLIGGLPSQPSLPDLPPTYLPPPLHSPTSRGGRPLGRIWEERAPPTGKGRPPQRVNQYDLEGRFIQSHPSQAHAAQSIGRGPSSLGRYLRLRKPYMGFLFILDHEDPNTMNNHEMWQTCKHCGLQFDRRLSDHCSECEAHADSAPARLPRLRLVRDVEYPKPQSIWNHH